MPAFTCVFLYTDDHALVFWPEEYCVSVVVVTNITAPCPPVVGQDCQVRICRKDHKGVTLELGTYVRTNTLLWNTSLTVYKAHPYRLSTNVTVLAHDTLVHRPEEGNG